MNHITLKVLLNSVPCDSKIKTIPKPIMDQIIGAKTLKYLPNSLVFLSVTFIIRLSAISLNGTLIHQACANCHKTNIEIKPNTKLKSDGKFISLLSGQAESFDIENIIFVGARLPRNEVYREVKNQLNDRNIYLVGDCVSPGIIQAAVLSGHSIARQIIDDKKNNNYFLRDQIETFNFK